MNIGINLPGALFPLKQMFPQHGKCTLHLICNILKNRSRNHIIFQIRNHFRIKIKTGASQKRSALFLSILFRKKAVGAGKTAFFSSTFLATECEKTAHKKKQQHHYIPEGANAEHFNQKTHGSLPFYELKNKAI